MSTTFFNLFQHTAPAVSLVPSPCHLFRQIVKLARKNKVFLNGPGERIRTSDFLVPNQTLYQAELHPDIFGAGRGTRTPTLAHQILSLAWLPITPYPHYLGAGGENRTPNLLITSELPYHWATPALYFLYYVFTVVSNTICKYSYAASYESNHRVPCLLTTLTLSPQH